MWELMRYTQQQALGILGIDQSTFVYWMRAVPRIQRLKGRGCHFERRDLFALAVLAELTRDVGIGISALEAIIPKLFDLFRDTRASELEKMGLVIDRQDVRLEQLPVACSGPNAQTILPMKGVVARVTAPERTADLLPLEQLMQRTGAP